MHWLPGIDFNIVLMFADDFDNKKYLIPNMSSILRANSTQWVLGLLNYASEGKACEGKIGMPQQRTYWEKLRETTQKVKKGKGM